MQRAEPEIKRAAVCILRRVEVSQPRQSNTPPRLTTACSGSAQPSVPCPRRAKRSRHNMRRCVIMDAWPENFCHTKRVCIFSKSGPLDNQGVREPRRVQKYGPSRRPRNGGAVPRAQPAMRAAYGANHRDGAMLCCGTISRMVRNCVSRCTGLRPISWTIPANSSTDEPVGLPAARYISSENAVPTMSLHP